MCPISVIYHNGKKDDPKLLIEVSLKVEGKWEGLLIPPN